MLQDIDLRQMGRPPSQTGDIDMRQNTQWNNGERERQYDEIRDVRILSSVIIGAPSPTFNNDPRIRTGGNEITEDVRDPRRRNQGGNQSQGNQMVNPWGNEQPPMQFK